MHHPGPPRFTTVGEAVELAPRSPSADADFDWRLADAPEDSDLSVGDGAVIHPEPDVPGTYRFELSAPDGTHVQRLRAFPDPRRPARFAIDPDRLPDHDFSEVSVAGAFNDHRFGADRPAREDGKYVFETTLPPGDHEAMFVPGYRRHEAVDAYCTVEGPERPRVALDATVEDGTVRVEADPLTGPRTEEDLDVEFYADDRDGVDDAALSVSGTTATLPLDAVEDRLRVHAVAVGARHSVPDCVDIEADGTVSYPNDPPAWLESATIYSVFTRAFAGEAETTFAEIERRVPYLEWLGVDTLWLTPVLASLSAQKGEDAPGGPHGYDTIEYDRLADDLGDREDLRSLVDTLHDHGIRLVFDLVLNHTSRNHPYFQMADAGVDPYADYYEFVDGDAQFYFNWHNIPNLNYDEPAVREMVLSVVEEWAEYADGFRCDVAWALDPGFWQEARERARSVDPDIAMLGEVIPRDPRYHQTNFDLHYDTSLYGMLRGVGEGHEPASTVLDAVESDAAEGFPPRATQMRYVENHDEPRYLDSCDRASLKAAVGAVCTLPDVPMVYAGQEMGMTEPREPLDWGGDDDLTRFHRRLLRTRNDSAALTHGSFERVDHDPDSDSGVAFARDHDGERLVVALNFGADPLDIWVDAALEPTDVVSGESVPVERHADGDGTTVTVDSVAVLETV